MKLLLSFLALTSLAFSRENPFFPPKNEELPSYTTNEVQKPKPFKSFSITLPDSARVLQKVSFTYINLDGSVTTKDVILNRSIDWHKPLTVSYKQDRAQTLKPQKKKLKKKETTSHLIGKLPFISFSANGATLMIKTEDTALRNFKLIKPDRIVIDFQRDVDFRSYNFTSSEPFLAIRLGNHSGYYRVVIELDGRYIYKFKKTDDGYIIKLQ